MDLPKNNYELYELFKNAKSPDVYEFKGEYLVDMLTIFPSLNKFSHRKMFYVKNNIVLGHNLLFKNRIWGHFFLEEDICKEVDSKKVVTINYNRSKNLFLTNKIRDHVRCLEHNCLYLGRFNYLFMNKLHFLGYFSLLKIK